MNSIELFAGIGGISLAAEWAGITTKAFCEREPFCQKVLKKHWPDTPIFDDVRTLNRKVLEENGVIEPGGTVGIISGGFPCQPFSIAGKRKGKEDDRDLWPEMFRIIEEIGPRWVVGENVANFVNMELDRTLFDLESIGYKGQSFIIPACGVDARHQRDRVFVVAHSRCELRKGSSIKRTDGVESKKQDANIFKRPSKMVSYSSCKRCNEMEQHDGRRTAEERPVCEDRKCSIKPRGKTSWWEPEPNVDRVAHGIPNRVDRLRGLGNAVVPQQIYPIFKAIMEIDNYYTK